MEQQLWVISLYHFLIRALEIYQKSLDQYHESLSIIQSVKLNCAEYKLRLQYSSFFVDRMQNWKHYQTFKP